jgi:hypothetical protein
LLQDISSLLSYAAFTTEVFPDQLKQIASEAFRDRLRWAFVSLSPWLGLSFLLCLFFSKVPEA